VCFRRLGGEAAYAVCRGLPDTGTSRTILHERVLRRAGIDYDPRGKEPITTANGTPLRCKGNVRLQVKVHGVEIFVDALVSSNLHAQCLVSWSDLQALGIIPADFPGGQAKAAANSAGTETVESIIEEFPDVFDETVISPMSGEPMHVHLRRDDAGYRPTRVSTARRVPLHFMEEAEKTLKWFLDSGVIIEVPPNESTEWCSPGFFVPKPKRQGQAGGGLQGHKQVHQPASAPFPESEGCRERDFAHIEVLHEVGRGAGVLPAAIG